MRLAVDLAVAAENVRNLDARPPLPRRERGWPVRMHRRLPEDLAFLGTEEVERALGASDVSLGHLGVAGGGLERRMAKQPLDDADVGTHLEQMGGEAVAQGMGCDALGEAALDHDLVQHALDGAGRDRTTRDGSG